MAEYNSAYTGAEIDASVGAFEIDAQTQISTKTPIVLDEATGNETALSLDYTVNKATSGNDTGLKINMTDTASPGTSLLMDLQVGGETRFSVRNDGIVFNRNELYIQNSTGSTNYILLSALSVGIHSALPVAWASTTNAGAGKDLLLYRDAANTLALRNSTNAQTFNIYNTYTDASNYERFKIKWDTNRLVLDTEEAGTGTARGITIGAADLIFSNLPTADPTVAGQLWSNGGVLTVSAG